MIGPNLKFKILTKPSFSILIKIQLRNLCKTSAAKYWKSCLNFNIKRQNKRLFWLPEGECWVSCRLPAVWMSPPVLFINGAFSIHSSVDPSSIQISYSLLFLTPYHAESLTSHSPHLDRMLRDQKTLVPLLNGYWGDWLDRDWKWGKSGDGTNVPQHFHTPC